MNANNPNPFTIPAPEGKKARLFYYEDTVGGYIPVPPEVTAKALSALGLDVEGLEPGVVVTTEFQRFDLSDEELANLPEANQ